MFIELVDALRCTGGGTHEETWLVAAVEEFHGRHILRGSLGCPLCRARFGVERGEVWFGGSPGEGSLAPPPLAAANSGSVEPREEEVLRARALLGLTDAGGVVALFGTAATLAPALEEASQCAFLLVNAIGLAPAPGHSSMRVGSELPLAAGTLRGALLGEVPLSESLAGGVVRALRPGGRLVAPVSQSVPDGVTELARDDRQWVGEKSGLPTSTLVPLRRG